MNYQNITIKIKTYCFNYFVISIKNNFLCVGLFMLNLLLRGTSNVPFNSNINTLLSKYFRCSLPWFGCLYWIICQCDFFLYATNFNMTLLVNINVWFRDVHFLVLIVKYAVFLKNLFITFIRKVEKRLKI